MSRAEEDARHPIRHGIEDLAGVAEIGRSEIGDLADSALAALDELTRATTAALPRDEGLALEAELRHVADSVRTTTEGLQSDVVAAIESETAELERLLRPEALASTSAATEAVADQQLRQHEDAQPRTQSSRPDESDDQLQVKLRDGTVVTFSTSVPDPLGWGTSAPVGEDRTPAGGNGSRASRITAILAKDGKSLAGGVEAALPLTHPAGYEPDTLAPSPGFGLMALGAIVTAAIQGVVRRHRRSRDSRTSREGTDDA